MSRWKRNWNKNFSNSFIKMKTRSPGRILPMKNFLEFPTTLPRGTTHTHPRKLLPTSSISIDISALELFLKPQWYLAYWTANFSNLAPLTSMLMLKFLIGILFTLFSKDDVKFAALCKKEKASSKLYFKRQHKKKRRIQKEQKSKWKIKKESWTAKSILSF